MLFARFGDRDELRHGAEAGGERIPYIARERAAFRAIVPLETVDFLDHVARAIRVLKRDAGQRGFHLRVVFAEIVVELLLICAVLLQSQPEFRRMGKGEVVRQVVAEDAEAQRVFRRKLFTAGHGLSRERFGENMDLTLAFEREVRV